jgi:hypothetical protein
VSGIDSYTKLMLHMDGEDGSSTFIDVMGKTVTRAGHAQIDTAQSVFGGASGLFDGSDDYVYADDSDDWDFGTGNFTVDFWYKAATSPPTTQGLCGQIVTNINNSFFLRTATAALYFAIISGGSYRGQYQTDNCAINDGNWHHIAIVRSGTSNGCIKIYVDGTSRTLSVYTELSNKSSVALAAPFEVGRVNTVGYTKGWIDEFRVSKGIARWTGDFSVPTAAYSSNVIGPFPSFRNNGGL